MRVSFDVAEYKKAVKRITNAVTNPTSLAFRSDKDTCSLTLETMKDGVGVSVKLTAIEVSESGEFCTDYTIIKNLFNSRKRVSLVLSESGNKVDFTTDTKMSGDFITVECIEYKHTQADMVALTEDQVLFIVQVLKNLNIEEFFFKNPLSVSLRFGEGGAYAVVSSDFHQAFVHKAGDFQEFSVRMPYKSLVSVIGISDEKSFKLSVSDSAILAESSDFKCSLPVENLQEDNFDDYLSLMLEVHKHKKVGYFESTDLKTSMSAISNLNSDGKAVSEWSIERDDSSLEIYIKTLKGTIKESVPLIKLKRSPAPFSIHPKAVGDLIKNMPDGLYALRVTDRLVSFSLKKDCVEYTYLTVHYEG